MWSASNWVIYWSSGICIHSCYIGLCLYSWWLSNCICACKISINMIPSSLHHASLHHIVHHYIISYIIASYHTSLHRILCIITSYHYIITCHASLHHIVHHYIISYIITSCRTSLHRILHEPVAWKHVGSLPCKGGWADALLNKFPVLYEW